MSYRLQSDDTTAAAEAVQVAIWRRMSPAQKLQLFDRLQQDVWLLAEAGIRRRFPNASEREVFLRRVALSLDRDTMIRAYGFDPLGQ